MTEMQPDPNKSRVEKAATTKMLKTRGRVLNALNELLATVPVDTITLALICRHAGVTADPLYKAHHRELKDLLEKKLSNARRENTAAGTTRRRRLSMTAEVKIDQLEKEIDRLKFELSNAHHGLNVLSQVLRTIYRKQIGARVVEIPNDRRLR